MRRMNVQTATTASSAGSLGVLRALLLLEAAAALVATIFLSALAVGVQRFLGDGETTIRLAAGGVLVFAILAAVAARRVRRRRASAWTLAALLQVLLAVGTAAAMIATTPHPAFSIGFAVAAIGMIVLSTADVRRALGQA